MTTDGMEMIKFNVRAIAIDVAVQFERANPDCRVEVAEYKPGVYSLRMYDSDGNGIRTLRHADIHGLGGY